MIKTKLILVDGITGSGKSTTAHFIARQMEKNGVRVKWYYEQEKNHPLRLDQKEAEKQKDESDADYSKRIMEKEPVIWTDFVNKIKDDDTVYIVESFLFQDVLLLHLMNDVDTQTIKDYSRKLLDIVRSLDPVLIHLYQKDVDKSLRLNWDRREEEWTKWFISAFEACDYCKNSNIIGEAGVIQLWQDFTDFTVDLFSEYDFRKLQIENSAQDWVNYRKKILKFLDLKYFEEKLYDSSFRRYFGEYLGNGNLAKFHEKNDRLLIDLFWPDIKLIPVSKNVCETEGFPITYKFYSYAGKKKIKLTKADCYYDTGSILNEYKPYNISEKELEKFCGEYSCEAEKLERKIYLKEGKLYYYWCELKAECQLLPIGRNLFTKLGGSVNTITFRKVKGKFHYKVWDKGHRSNAVFVKKENSGNEKIEA
jgi:hypothetical protein